MRFLVLVGLILVCAGCRTTEMGSAIKELPPVESVEEISIKIAESCAYDGDSRIEVTLYHETHVQEKGASVAQGKKTRFSIPVDAGVWMRVKRCDEEVGYEVVSECLIDGEMVPVSGMPGDNFTVKVEELALQKYRVMGVFLCRKQSETCDSEKTVTFDFVSNLNHETPVFRETVTHDL